MARVFDLAVGCFWLMWEFLGFIFFSSALVRINTVASLGPLISISKILGLSRSPSPLLLEWYLVKWSWPASKGISFLTHTSYVLQPTQHILSWTMQRVAHHFINKATKYKLYTEKGEAQEWPSQPHCAHMGLDVPS
jgi:hypothetical protein